MYSDWLLIFCIVRRIANVVRFLRSLPSPVILSFYSIRGLIHPQKLLAVSNLTFDLDFLLAIDLVHLPFFFFKCFASTVDLPNFLFSSIGCVSFIVRSKH